MLPIKFGAIATAIKANNNIKVGKIETMSNLMDFFPIG